MKCFPRDFKMQRFHQSPLFSITRIPFSSLSTPPLWQPASRLKRSFGGWVRLNCFPVNVNTAKRQRLKKNKSMAAIAITLPKKKKRKTEALCWWHHKLTDNSQRRDREGWRVTPYTVWSSVDDTDQTGTSSGRRNKGPYIKKKKNLN